MRDLLRRVLRVIEDIAYGFDSGSAIQHGLPPVERQAFLRRGGCRDAAR